MYEHSVQVGTTVTQLKSSNVVKKYSTESVQVYGTCRISLVRCHGFRGGAAHVPFIDVFTIQGALKRGVPLNHISGGPE